MLARFLIIQAVALGITLAQERTFGFGTGGSFLGLGPTSTEGPIYQQIQGLAPNQHGYTLIDPNYARQYAQDVKKPEFGGNTNQRPQNLDYQKQIEAQDAFIRQVAEANKNRVQPSREFRPSQPLPPPQPEGQDFRFSQEPQTQQQSELGSEEFIRNPPPPPPPPPKIPFNFEQHSGSLRRPPPMATPPPPPHTTRPSLKNFPNIPIQPTNPPLVIPELLNQDLPQHPPSLFSNDANHFEMVEFQRTRPAIEQTVTQRAPVVRHRARPIPHSQTQTRGQLTSLSDDSVFEQESTPQVPVHKKRIHVIKKPIIIDDFSDDNNAQFNEDVAKDQASHAQYEFQSSVQDSVNGQEQIRQETRDGLRLKGLYSYSDGFFKRTVYYVADENGYRVIKEESEPIGSGPQYDPNGQVDVQSSFGGSGHHYSITGQQLEAAKRKSSSRN